MSFLPRAWTGEILRSAQKDENFLKDLTAQISEQLLRLLGAQRWLSWHQVIQANIRFAYYFLTTLSDYQTLGEEYAGILQVRFQEKNIPSKLRRLLSIFFHCYGLLFSSFLAKRVETLITKKEEKSESEKVLKKKALTFLTFVKKVLDFAEKLNLSTFYIQGVYYHFSKRMTQIGYSKLRASSIDLGNVQNYGGTFKTLGYLTLLNLVGSTGFNLIQNHLKKGFTTDDSGSNQSEVVPTGLKCPLCLDLRCAPACTPCGHIFCWQCIIEAVSAKPECPICRESIHNHSRLVPIMNYNQKFCKPFLQ